LTLFGQSYVTIKAVKQFTNEDAKRVGWGTYVHTTTHVFAKAEKPETQRLTLAPVEAIGSAKEKNANFPILKRVSA
jgi:hypothetical protein